MVPTARDTPPADRRGTTGDGTQVAVARALQPGGYRPVCPRGPSAVRRPVPDRCGSRDEQLAARPAWLVSRAAPRRSAVPQHRYRPGSGRLPWPRPRCSTSAGCSSSTTTSTASHWAALKRPSPTFRAGPTTVSSVGRTRPSPTTRWCTMPDGTSWGGTRTVFIGGALLVDLDADSPAPFPPVYNEDRLFLYDALADSAVVVGPPVHQLPYKPYADPGRAGLEEFGDVLGEGLLHLFHEDDPVTVAFDRDYWATVLVKRGKLLGRITERARELSASGKDPERMRQVVLAMTEVSAAAQAGGDGGRPGRLRPALATRPGDVAEFYERLPARETIEERSSPRPPRSVDREVRSAGLRRRRRVGGGQPASRRVQRKVHTHRSRPRTVQVVSTSAICSSCQPPTSCVANESGRNKLAASPARSTSAGTPRRRAASHDGRAL